jgi:hypothetical protein
VISSPEPSTHGDSVTLTATGTDARATGTVTFKDSGVRLDSVMLSDGVATYSTSDLTLGSHYITIVYGGDENFAASINVAYLHKVKAPPGINWWLIGRIIAAGVLIGKFFLLLWRRRRKRKQQPQAQPDAKPA